MKSLPWMCFALSVSAIVAQGSEPQDLVQNACGDSHTVFTANPVAPTSLVPGNNVYFIETEQKQLKVCIGPCGIVLRAGLDGQWKGATRGNTYFGFAVPPGLHHLCSNRQTHVLGGPDPTKLLSLVVEPGKTYYFEAHFDAGSPDVGPTYTFQPIDPDQAKYLMATSKLSDFHQKH